MTLNGISLGSLVGGKLEDRRGKTDSFVTNCILLSGRKGNVEDDGGVSGLSHWVNDGTAQ